MSVNDEAARTAIAADIEQMDAIIGQFLDYARAAGDEGIVDTDIEQLLNDVAARFARSGIRLHLDCPPLPSARLRPLAVARAVGNLIENARKYGGGEITLAARRCRPPCHRDHGSRPGHPGRGDGAPQAPVHLAGICTYRCQGTGLGWPSSSASPSCMAAR